MKEKEMHPQVRIQILNNVCCNRNKKVVIDAL